MGGETWFGKGLIEIILCCATEGRRDKGFGFAMVHNRPIHILPGAPFDHSCRRFHQCPPPVDDIRGLRTAYPPACLLDMQGEPLEYEEGVSLSMRFPVLPRYANPLGHMQGGYIVAALDNTLGPFSYLIAPPSVTSALNTQYLRPVTADTAFITCIARLSERTRGTLYLIGEARNPEGKIVALCQATCQILSAKG